MDWQKVHVGQHRQGPLPPDELKAGAIGINPDIHAPEISNPADEAEMNLHGDVKGSPYSTTPGEISLSEAGEKSKKDGGSAAADEAGTREREVESRRTAVPTETLAAEDEAGDTKKSSAKPAAKK